MRILGFGISFTGCSFESLESDEGYLLSLRGTGSSVQGCYFEAATKAVIISGHAWASPSVANKIAGCYMTAKAGLTSVGITAKMCFNTTVDNCCIRGFNTAFNTDDGYIAANDCRYLDIVNTYTKRRFFRGASDTSLRVQQGSSWNLLGSTKDGLESSIIESRYTTADSLLDVSINKSDYAWRTWIGGRTGADGGVRPTAEINLGGASSKWAQVFAVDGVISTSDGRMKSDIEPLSDKEKRVALDLKSNLVRFRWNSSKENKGEQARVHVGVIAQTVIECFKKEGLDAFDYGLLCFDKWEEELDSDNNVLITEGEQYSVRYTELVCFILAGL